MIWKLQKGEDPEREREREINKSKVQLRIWKEGRIFIKMIIIRMEE
jgi:hypothetical protein